MTISLLHKDHFTVNKEGKIIFTFSDLQKLPEWPTSPLLEIIDGELYIVPSPTPNHQDIVLNLAMKLKQYIADKELGRIWVAPIDVIFSQTDVVIPDLVYVSKDNNKIISEKNLQGIPDLLIEVLSTNKNHDMVFKKDLYERYGVEEYWIIDPTNETIALFNLQKQRFDLGKEFKNDEILKSNVIDGFELKTSSIFQFD